MTLLLPSSPSRLVCREGLLVVHPGSAPSRRRNADLLYFELPRLQKTIGFGSLSPESKPFIPPPASFLLLPVCLKSTPLLTSSHSSRLFPQARHVWLSTSNVKTAAEASSVEPNGQSRFPPGSSLFLVAPRADRALTSSRSSMSYADRSCTEGSRLCFSSSSSPSLVHPWLRR